MTRETKIGLLLGMGVILLIGIIISDQLSQVQQDPADFTGFAAESQRSIDASDATPAPGYAPGYGPGYAPGRSTAPSTVTDVPGGFFIPDDVQATLPQRQADAATTDRAASGTQPLTAYNVSEDPDSQDYDAEDDIPTLTFGNPTPQLPVFAQATQPLTEQPETTRRVEATQRTIPAPTDASVIRHTVQSGESLIKIARRYYGDGEYWKAIALANPGKVSNDGSVMSGAVLDIPKRDDAVLGLDIVDLGLERTAPVDTRTATTGSGTIVVESGDTLSELASKHLGTATKWEDLLEANKDQLDGPQSLRVGMKLRLPGGSSQAQATATNIRPTTQQTRSGKTYTVRPGDNLTEIAERTLGDGDKWQLVYEANRDKLKSPDRLIVGQELRIPG